MRMIVTGKTQSGKSTSLHRILSHALRYRWAGVLLLDGKGSEMPYYVTERNVIYYGAEEIGMWAGALENIVTGMAERYLKLVARGLRTAQPGDPKWLIIADEIQEGTRDSEFGKRIRNSLTSISERSAALGDVLILSTQREINAIPPSTHHNFNVWLRMLGAGYYYLQVDGQAKISGRTSLISPEESLGAIHSGIAAQELVPTNLFDILGSQTVQETRAPATLYTGAKGCGKTWRLQNHVPTRTVQRRIYVDFAQSHRTAVTTIIEEAGAVVPSRVTIPQLSEIAALALQSEPTLLLIDNLDQASDAMLPTAERLIEATTECALAAQTPQTHNAHRKLKPLVARVKTVEIKPLSREASLALAHKHLPAVVADIEATNQRILALGKGHPATIVDLSMRTQKGTLDEVRHYESAQNEPVNLLWLLALPAFFLLLMWKADGYIVAAFGMLALFIVRRLVMHQFRFRLR